VAWVHPLDSRLVEYRAYDKPHTLPSFWCLCERCEDLYQAGDDDAAVEVTKAQMKGFWDTERDVDETIRKPIAVFRRADRGGRRVVS
jgi:hypothetical protein